MLVGNRNCSIALQYYIQAEKEYMRANFGEGENPQCLLVLEGYFNSHLWNADKVKQAWAIEAGKVLGLSANVIADHEMVLGHYGMAMSGAFFAYNPAEEIPAKRMSLYTTSMSYLENLANKGLLIDNKKLGLDVLLDGIKKKLFGGIINKKISDNDSVYAVRLDPVVDGGNVRFTLTVPRTCLKLSTHYFIAYDVVGAAYDLFDQLLRNSVLRLDIDGKIRVVTKNVQVLNMVYNPDGSNAQHVENMLNERYDVKTLRFYCPVVGASRYTAGITNVRLTEINNIKKVSLAEIDLRDVNVNILGAKLEAYNQLQKASAKKYVEVAKYLELQTEDKEEILTEVSNLYDMDAWQMMKDLPTVFSTEKFLSKPNRYGTLYEPQALPISISNLESLLSQGVYKILVRRRSGSFSTIVTTSNPALLTKILGKGYEAKLESEGSRARFAIKALETGGNPFDVAKKYNLPIPEGCVSAEDYLTHVRKVVDEATARATVVKQSGMLTVRCLDATSPKDFYAQVNVLAIKELYRLA